MPKTKWQKLVAKYHHLYKEGFFELPYLSNSAQIMVNSVLELKLAKNKPLENAIYSNNPFCNRVLFYREISTKLALLSTHIHIKQNCIAKAIYDDNQLTNNYILSFSVFEYEFPIPGINGNNVKLLSTCWTFYKQNTEVETYFFKNTQGKFYNILFDKSWANQNIFFEDATRQEVFNRFLDSEIGFYTWLDIAPQAHDIAHDLDTVLKNENQGVFDLETISKSCQKLIDVFFDNAFQDKWIVQNTSLSNIDYAKIAKAEKIILQNLHLPFVGVAAIATEINMSPTKLKSNFKTVFGYSLLQYHKEKNMLLAMQLLQKSVAMIQTIAAITGYESASKFTAAFKKRFGKLPTAVIR